MKKREFNKVIKDITTGKYLDKEKIKLLSNDIKKELVGHIIRNRAPIIIDLIPEDKEFISWLHCMGYMYTTKGKLFTFQHTCEHKIK
jgi:hypothetical protein